MCSSVYVKVVGSRNQLVMDSVSNIGMVRYLIAVAMVTLVTTSNMLFGC